MLCGNWLHRTNSLWLTIVPDVITTLTGARAPEVLTVFRWLDMAYCIGLRL